jgi:phosphoribosylcarboxyaminoimidazole (NCAIR) mutase
MSPPQLPQTSEQQQAALEEATALVAEEELEAEAESEAEAEFADLAVDSPHVGIVMGAESEMGEMSKAAEELTKRDIMHEVRVMSADTEPDTVAEYAQNARMRGLKVIIAGAGASLGLPGVVAEHTDLPVIGVPLTGPRADINNAAHAGILAARILGV